MNSKVLKAVDKAGTDACGDRLAQKLSGLVNAGRVVENEGVLECDDVTLHALDLGHVGDTPGTVAQSGNLDDEVHCGCDLFADSAQRQIHSSHENKGLETGDGVTRR